MNQRIKVLMEQSMPAIDWKARYGVELNNGERLEYMTQWYEKFAELIVKECSYLADQAHYKATGGKSAGGYIRQHFGIKE
jgi:hypothetical protein